MSLDALELAHEQAQRALVEAAGAFVDAVACFEAAGPAPVARAFTALRVAVVDERLVEGELGVALAAAARGPTT